MAIYFYYKENKENVLFTTNIAARGLDFPRIQWVVQFDAPDDLRTYVHRVGRTARFVASGKALTFLDPTEIGLLEELQSTGIHPKKVNARFSFLKRGII